MATTRGTLKPYCPKLTAKYLGRKLNWDLLLPQICKLITDDLLSPPAACGIVGIEADSLYDACKASSSIAAAIKIARQSRLAWFERNHIDIAKNGEGQETLFDEEGNVTAKINKAGRSGATIFFLKTQGRAVDPLWAEHQPQDTSDRPSPTVIVQLDLRELAKLEAAGGVRTIARVENVTDAVNVEGVS